MTIPRSDSSVAGRWHDLTQVCAAWERLPEAIRAGTVAMVEVSGQWHTVPQHPDGANTVSCLRAKLAVVRKRRSYDPWVMDYALTQHARDALQKRKIMLVWLERALFSPQRTEADALDTALEHRLPLFQSMITVSCSLS